MNRFSWRNPMILAWAGVFAIALSLLYALSSWNFSSPGGLPFYLPFFLLPVLFHLLTRPRPREVEFSGTHFLPQQHPPQRRKFQLEDLPYLLLRLGALAALLFAALGLSRISPSSRALIGVKDPLFLVDGSGSMWLNHRGQDSLERAARLIEELVGANRWEHYTVWLCRGKEPVQVFESRGASRQALQVAFKDWATLGFADLKVCSARIPVQGEGQDLVILSDLPPPSPPPPVHSFRSLYWIGVGAPARNSGIGRMEIKIAGEELTITGAVQEQGREGKRLRLHWLNETRPDLIVPVTDHGFHLVTLLPVGAPRAVLTLEPLDDSPWDNRVPLVFPERSKPRIAVAGLRTQEVERYLWEFLLASSNLFEVLRPDPILKPEELGVAVLFSPWAIPAALNERYLSALERGAKALVFPGEGSEREQNQPTPWIPGWLHPPQPVQEGGVYPTSELLREHPELSELPWNVVEVKQLYPLGDPDPRVKPLLVTHSGLPVLVSYPYGEGILYLFLFKPELTFTNIHLTAAWVPLWLALTGVMGRGPRVFSEPLSPEELEGKGWEGKWRIEALDRLGTEAWTGWLTLTGKKEAGIVAVRTSEKEILPGDFQEIVELVPPRSPLSSAQGGSLKGEDRTLWAMGFFLSAFLLQAFLPFLEGKGGRMNAPSSSMSDGSF